MSHYSLPLFPLGVVICPGGLLPLEIFETRYIDMVRNCLRHQSPFVIVSILPETEISQDYNFPFARVGTFVDIIDADVTTLGMMQIRCIGQHRVKINSYSIQANGLVIGEVTDIANDLPHSIPKDLVLSSRVLKQLIANLPDKDLSLKNMPVVEPYLFEDASWVSNRWVELLDLPLIQKQRLMEIDSSIIRLELINDIIETGYQKIF
ncbi:MAG TPA: LON peptidase substrate-binding domain-containing protein [Methylotenera sp.]|nr:LON peptidase substrate-binding domain-containing protein [Methylotenera sp.]